LAALTVVLGAVSLLRATDPPKLLLADDSHPPRVTVSWPARGGETVTLEGERPYRSPGDKTLLGKNIECYASLGGTRVDKGCGHPDGAVIRVGLYKVDARRPFFESMADGGTLTIRLEGVFMNQPAVPRPKTGFMHLRYMMSDLANCGISPDGRNLYITASPEDRVLKIVAKDSARPGALDGGGADHGSVIAEQNADGSSTITFHVPYALLRHLKDPSQRVAPGGFFEPQHFHCEIEFLPREVAAAEDRTGSGQSAHRP
jgi:hypothetical protein